ncbi:MAG: hypothetical protein NUW01_00430 [Gemmatimonadaceae bacterium]|nr:hypothetical protein [Gemmatimonadaceae bacterium]
MIPGPELTARIASEIDLVLAFLPWLPRPGVIVDVTPSGVPSLFYRWNEAEQAPYIVVPPNWDTDDAALRRLVRHESGHHWLDALGRRRGGSYDAWAALQIDPAYPGRHEIAADIFARVMGEQPSYWGLEPLSRPTEMRVIFVTTSGRLPDRTTEKVLLAQDIGRFWQGTDIPAWYRDYAANFQKWLDLYVIEPLRIK